MQSQRGSGRRGPVTRLEIVQRLARQSTAGQNCLFMVLLARMMCYELTQVGVVCLWRRMVALVLLARLLSWMVSKGVCVGGGVSPVIVVRCPHATACVPIVSWIVDGVVSKGLSCAALTRLLAPPPSLHLYLSHQRVEPAVLPKAFFGSVSQLTRSQAQVCALFCLWFANATASH